MVSARRAARLVDVADLAGVTASTASRALARPEMVRSETRVRVEAAARELGYVPNRVARSLITGRTATVGIVVPDLTLATFALTARAVEAAARDRGYDMLVADSLGDPEREVEIVTEMVRWSDGVILCMPRRTYHGDPGGPPIVYVNRRARGAHAVLVDQAAVVETQLTHLFGLGHRNVLLVNGPKDYWASDARRRHAERLAGRFPVEVAAPVPPTFEGGFEVADSLEPGITAVATFADGQAAGVIARCAERGVRVPEDLSVMGSNDVPLARMVTPPLTTVRTPFEGIGRAAASLLLDHIDFPEGPAIVETLTPELVVRGSTAPPRGASRPGRGAVTP